MISFTLQALQQARKRDFEEISSTLWESSRYNNGRSSVPLIKEFMREEGFHITECEAEDAFVAEWGEGSPVIGFIGEFGINDMNDRESSSCDGLNLSASAAMEAAVLTAEDLKRNEEEGTVIFYGSPTSESGRESGIMVSEGLFDKADAVLAWQGSDKSGIVASSPSGAVVTYDFFSEETASAFIDNLVLVKNDESTDADIEWTEEGERVSVSIKSSSLEEVRKLLGTIRVYSEKTAQMKGESVNSTLLSARSGIVENRTLSSIVEKNASSVFPIRYTEEELRYASLYALDKADPISSTFDKRKIRLSETSDFGSVSRTLPSSLIEICCYAKGSTERRKQSRTDAAFRGMHAAAVIMAATAVDILGDEELLLSVKRDFRKEMK